MLLLTAIAALATTAVVIDFIHQLHIKWMKESSRKAIETFKIVESTAGLLRVARAINKDAG